MFNFLIILYHPCIYWTWTNGRSNFSNKFVCEAYYLPQISNKLGISFLTGIQNSYGINLKTKKRSLGYLNSTSSKAVNRLQSELNENYEGDQ